MKLYSSLFAFVLTVPALGQQNMDLLPPTPGNVTLSLDEYNRLLALANRPGKKSEAPPQPYVLRRADLKFRVSNDDVLGSIQIEGETLATNATKIPLASGMTIFDARLGAKPLPLLLENGSHVTVLPGESEFSVNLDAGLPLSIESGRASFVLPAPSAGSVRLTLSVPGDRANVQINHGIITRRSSSNGVTEVEATLSPGQPANVWWATREVVTPATPREVRFLSEVKTLVSVSESALQVAALADLSVVQGEADQFSVALPEGFEVTSVNGPTLESSEIQNGVLLLKVAPRNPASHQFLIALEQPLSDAKATAPVLAFKQAQRETGEVLVEGQGTLELTAKESGGLKRLDIKEVNPYLRALSQYSLQSAFRYHRQPNESPALALEWTRFPDASVLSAVAERATVTTLVTSEGRSLTEVKLTIKNQAQPFLKVDLPEGSILTAEVSGEKVKPVQGADGSRVPLLRAGFRPAGAYTVSFVFLHSGSPFAKKGDSELSLPKMDVPIGMLEWEVFLPDRYNVKQFGGDALSASLWPYGYVAGGGVGGVAAGSYQAGVGVGMTTGVDVNLPRSVALPMEGRDATQILTLQPGVALTSNQLGGTVIDPSGGVIPNARVQVRNTQTNATWNATTDSSGSWLLGGVPSGPYTISVSAQGFQTLNAGVSYDASQPRSYQTALSLGAMISTVMVEAQTAQVETQSSWFGKKAKAAPLPPPPPSPNVLNLQQRVAGVLPVAVNIPRTGTSYRFLRPLVLNEETKLTFLYKSK